MIFYSKVQSGHRTTVMFSLTSTWKWEYDIIKAKKDPYNYILLYILYKYI